MLSVKSIFKGAERALSAENIRKKIASLEEKRPFLEAEIGATREGLVRALAMDEDTTAAKTRAAEASAALAALPAAREALLDALAITETREAEEREASTLTKIEELRPKLEKAGAAAAAAVREYMATLERLFDDSASLQGNEPTPFAEPVGAALEIIEGNAARIIEGLELSAKVGARALVRRIADRRENQRRGLL
jgi:uncharacterized protein YhaN